MTAELHLLGGAALSGADGQLVSGAAAQPRRMAVLAVLADAWPGPVTRDRLVGLIWPDQDEQGAKRLLTQALYALRRELGDFTQGAGRDVVLDPAILRVDLIDFRRAIAAGDLQRAAALYRGPVLDGVHVRGAVEFERWAQGLRDATRRQFQTTVGQIAASYGEAGEWREAAHWAERLVAESPYDIGSVVRLIDCWAQAGDLGAALAAANAYEQRIRTELELEPDPAVRRRARDAIATAHGGAATVELDGLHAPEPSPMTGSATTPADPPLVIGAAPGTPAPEPVPVSTRGETRPWAHPLAWLLGAAAVAATSGMLFFARPKGVTTGPAVVHVVPFQTSGDATVAAAGAEVASLLAASLDGSGGAEISIRPDDAAVPTPWAVLHGQVAGAGSTLRFDATLVETGSGRTLASASVTGPRDSLLALAERLSLRLVPGFYAPEVRARMNPRTIAGLRSAAALRELLEGEAALRHGAFGDAHAHFAAATVLDSTSGLTWYRRAVAAEMAHRPDDAAASLRAAGAREASLTERGRLRLEAFRLWREGRADSAETMYRRLVTGDSQDREAWFHLAEIEFHGGPLRGQPLDRSRDSWDRVVELDSGDLTGLMHAIRLHARAGDARSAQVLLRHAEDAGARGASLAESQVIAAVAASKEGIPREADRILDSIPEYSLQFLQAVVAGQLERPEAATSIARRMITPDRPASLQGQGYIALAHLALATGRWREAMLALDSAATRNPVAAEWTRAYFVSLPFVHPGQQDRGAAEKGLAGVADLRAPAPLYLQLGVATSAASVIQPYLQELLQRTARDAEGTQPAEVDLAIDALACPREAQDAFVVPLCEDLRRGLQAERARRRGAPGAALQHLDDMNMQVSYQYAGRSQLLARSRERLVHAMLLEQSGRDTEAEERYEALPHGAWADYIFLAPSYLGRARLHERGGDRAGAAALYRRVLQLQPTPDPELAALHREARAGLARVTARQ